MSLNLEGVIPLIGGVVVLMMATGKIGTNLEWIKNHAKTVKIVAPLVIVFGILMLFRVF